MLRGAVQGKLVPWRDVLHEGPVFAGLPLQTLSRHRAKFIAEALWAPLEEVERGFAERDATLRAASEHEEVVLWFEHDLYDQLQLIQLLDWFAAHRHPRLALVCEAEYLGTMTSARAAELFRSRRPVNEAQLAAASAAWGAFGAPRPETISTAFIPELPYLGAALRRLLEEYPWADDGLSRLERQILNALRDGPLEFDELFARAHYRVEEPVFVGDAVLRWHLGRLEGDGFVKSRNSWSLTAKAEQVLSGALDAWDAPRRARWIGGYEIRDARLRWDPRAQALRRFASGSTTAAPRR